MQVTLKDQAYLQWNTNDSAKSQFFLKSKGIYVTWSLVKTYKLVVFSVLTSNLSIVSRPRFPRDLHREVSLLTLSPFLDSSPHSLCLTFLVYFSTRGEMFANLRNRKKLAPRDNNKGKEKVDDDAPHRSKRQRNEVGDHDD